MDAGPASDTGSSGTVINESLELLRELVSKVDSLDKQIRSQGAEQHFEVRRVEKALSEKMERLVAGGGVHQSALAGEGVLRSFPSLRDDLALFAARALSARCPIDVGQL